MTDVRCRCGNKLAERDGNLWVFKIRGRLIVTHTVLAMRCERCGADVVPGAPALAEATA